MTEALLMSILTLKSTLTMFFNRQKNYICH